MSLKMRWNFADRPMRPGKEEPVLRESSSAGRSTITNATRGSHTAPGSGQNGAAVTDTSRARSARHLEHRPPPLAALAGEEQLPQRAAGAEELRPEQVRQRPALGARRGAVAQQAVEVRRRVQHVEGRVDAEEHAAE